MIATLMPTKRGQLTGLDEDLHGRSGVEETRVMCC